VISVPADEGIIRRIRLTIAKSRPRRVELCREESDELRACMERMNAAWRRSDTLTFFEPFPDAEWIEELHIKGVRVLLDRPETRFVQWDDYELLQVLSATCFTPDPEVTK
jgi:hypothetical protein